MTAGSMRQYQISLLLTAPHPCSYLEGREATTAFVDPETTISPNLFTRLAELGFRRSGMHLYRPQCEGCQACIPVRLPVFAFRPNRSQRRCLKVNEDLQITQLDHIDNEECYQLYERYVNARHHDGDMYPPTRDQFRSFLCAPWPGSFYLALRDGKQLIAISLCDRFRNGLSAVYTFYDPDIPHRSLGVYAILNQIVRAQLEGLEYLYLGYWIRDCRKMTYKTQYRPYELLLDGQWQLAE